jgi:hypothetical protein
VETWGFIWIMLILKIPLGLLLWLVWWAVHATPEYEDAPGGDGGSHDRPHPPRRPRRRPRGPHGDPAPLPAPPRVRTVVKARKTPQRAA